MAKSKQQCLSCDKPTSKKEVICEPCYEEARKILLDEVARRDLLLTQKNTQIALLETTVRNQQEMLGELRKTTSERQQKTA